MQQVLDFFGVCGSQWSGINHATYAFGMATPGGIIGSTGIAGLTLGGGIGYLSRAFGLTCDNLLSADVVTADGRFLVASRKENEDLFWALLNSNVVKSNGLCGATQPANTAQNTHKNATTAAAMATGELRKLCPISLCHHRPSFWDSGCITPWFINSGLFIC